MSTTSLTIRMLRSEECLEVQEATGTYVLRPNRRIYYHLVERVAGEQVKRREKVSALKVLGLLHKLSEIRSDMEGHERKEFGKITGLRVFHTYWSQKFVDSTYHFWRVTDEAGNEVAEKEASRLLRSVFKHVGSTEKTAAYWLGTPASVVILPIDGEKTGTLTAEQPIRRLLEQYAEVLRNEKIVGTTLSRRDVTPGAALYMPYNWDCAPDASLADGNLVDALVRSLRKNDPRERWLIVGDIGAGKSVLAFLLFEHLSVGHSGEGAPLAVHMDLANWPRSRTQTLDSLDDALDLHFRGLWGSWQSQQVIQALSLQIRSGRAILILDSLDELCEKLRVNECEDVLNSRLVSEARLITCRRPFFESRLPGTPLPRRNIVYLRDIKANVHGWVSAYVKALYEKKGLHQKTPHILEALSRNPELLHFASRPLSLNMLLDVLSAELPLAPGIRSLPNLFVEFTWNWLERESRRDRFDVTKVFELLTSIAWQMHEQGEFMASAPAIERLCDSAGATEMDREVIRHRSFLVSTGVNIGGPTFRFAHPQFRHFFAARAMWRFLEQGEDATAKALAVFLPAEITDGFLVPLLLECKPGERRRVVCALTKAWCNNTDTPLRDRMVREHAGYALGRIGTTEAIDFLVSKVATEKDPWVHRGTVIALAFAGRPKFLSQYVDKLAKERERGEYRMRAINIGYHLTYYGDQPSYDANGNWCPDEDAGGTRCERTVMNVLRHLMSAAYRPIWRLDVATLLDLASQPNRREEVDSLLDRELLDAERIADNVKDAGKEWPEAEDFIRYLCRLKDKRRGQ